MNIINDVLVDKIFKDPPKRTKEIPLLSEKTASGDGMVIIKDAYPDFPFKNLTFQGNTQQDSTTGKNLFDADSERNGYISVGGNIDAQQGIKNEKYGDYIPINSFFKTVCVTTFVTITGNGESAWCGVAFYDKDKKFIIRVASGTTIVKANIPENAFYMIGTYRKYKDGVLQIEYGSVSTEYEPYTGGKPSPSPEYPQEIKSVGKLNELTGKYEIDVKVTGKNLFDMDRFVDTCKFIRNDDGTFLINKQINRYDCFIPKDTILSINTLKIQDTTGASILQLFHEDGSSMYIGCSKIGINFVYIKKDVIYIKVLAYRQHLYKYIQVERGTVPTSYEPYKEQTLTLTSDRPITKFDKLVEQDGQIGWLYGGTVKEYAGGGGMSLYNSGFAFELPGKKIVNGEGYCEELCSRKCVQGMPNISFKNAENEYAYTLNTQAIYGSTVSEIREYLKQHPLHLVYQTEATEFIPLPQSEQDAIRTLKTYYPTTVITVDGGELPVGMEVTYMKPDYVPTQQSALRMWFKENPII